MRILLERRSLQGEAHLEREGVRGERLTTFLASLEAVAGTHAPRWSEGPVTEEALAGADVFIVPTKLEPYTRAEGDAIEAFVARGSGLWILSNHRPFHEADGLLASRFGVVLESTFLRTVGATTVIRGENLRPHAVLESDGGKVEALVTNTTCSIRSEKGTAVALLPETMRDKHTGVSPGGGLFAHALDGKGGGVGEGRVLTVADSGFLGDNKSRIPGPGQIEEGDNLLFIRNAVLWLSGR